MDDYTLAKKLFRSKPSSDSSALSATVTTFEALALSDSANGLVTIDMGGAVTSGNGQQGVEVSTTVVVKKGQTVIVQNSGGSLVVIGVIGGEDGLKDDLEQDITDQIVQAGEDLEKVVIEELKPIQDSFDQFKQDHQLTDEEITTEITNTKTELGSQISGAIETADAAYSATTTLSQTVDQIQSTAEEHYEVYDKGFVNLESSISQTATDIRAEVSKELYNEDGTAKYTTKSDLELAEDEISASVEGTVMEQVDGKINGALYDEEGNAIYTSKSDLSLNNKELSLTIKQTYIDPVENTANNANTTANNANNTANDAMDAVEEIETYIKQTIYGIDVGDSSDDLFARVSPDPAFKIMSGTPGTSATSIFSISYANYKTTINGNTNKALELSAGTASSSNSPKVKLQDGIELDGGSGSIYLNATSSAVYKDTASKSFLSSSGDSVVVGAKLLFSGSKSGSVSLNTSSSSFAMMTIVYSDGSRQMSQTVYSPSGKSVALFRSVNNGSTTYLQSEIVTISGSTISRGLCGQVDIKNSAYPSVDSSVRFTIEYVIGWTG